MPSLHETRRLLGQDSSDVSYEVHARRIRNFYMQMLGECALLLLTPALNHSRVVWYVCVCCRVQQYNKAAM